MRSSADNLQRCSYIEYRSLLCLLEILPLFLQLALKPLFYMFGREPASDQDQLPIPLLQKTDHETTMETIFDIRHRVRSARWLLPVLRTGRPEMDR